ncbi:hypothetical protein [Pseudoduganella namucuonensis]|uniref:Uncharacterized protein n=1 Tax=Pseudoduganella namucuonensis TaxID=1035707 RepID=A0A1I7GNY8_9BURK|nr:hypothetical protein [Pseudoduganella namucuonensis]SFU50150.1 hypothetical protein SAMN05216552_10043 [Pseudoduganella namucuonensis]
MTSTVNWIAAYNYLFAAFNSENKELYVSGATFCRMVQQIDPGAPSYQQLLPLRQGQGKSNSRKDFYWDLIQGLPEPERFSLYRVFINHIEVHDKPAADNLRNIVFGGGYAVPTMVVPVDLWNSEKLNNSLKDIDRAIDAHQYNRATTLSYTCLEGLYKTYVRKNVPDQAGLTDLMPLCKVVKDDISKRLQAQGPFPVEIVNSMPTLTNAIANSRNGFSESHFAGDSQRWLALFARDLTNSIGRLLLNFM